MKLILLILPIITLGQFEKDKQMHYFAGMAISGMGYQVSESLFDGKYKFVLSVGSATAIGILKEISDNQNKSNKFDEKDLAYTFLGGVTSYFLAEVTGIKGGIFGGIGILGLGVKMSF